MVGDLPRRADPIGGENIEREGRVSESCKTKIIARRSRALAEGEGPGAAGPSDHPAKILGQSRESKAFDRKVPRDCHSGSGVFLGSGYEFDLLVMLAQPQKKFYLQSLTFWVL